MTFGADGVTVAFGDVAALNEVTVDLAPGEVTAVVGADGAGKTTMMRALAGLVDPDGGSVRKPGIEQLGYLPSGAGSWKSLTVAENVAFVGSSYGLTGAELARRADPILEGAGLANVTDRLAGELSGGMRTKLGVSLALLHAPDLLILDEPTTGVDPVSRVELWRMISEIATDGTTVAMATTYMDEAERAGSVVMLGEGQVLLSGTSDDLIAAMPGVVAVVDTPVDPSLAWRVGPVFHEWFAHGPPDGVDPLQPDLEDACIVAAITNLTDTDRGAP
ncbi:MAG: ABC transporter ATP-binding protein [Actinomycetota bacterium]